MKNKKKIYIFILLFFLCFITGCNSKEEEEKESGSENQKPPYALEKVQQLSDEIVNSTMGQDWPGSLDKVKELQTNWNELYPDLQKKGVAKDDVDAFVSDLNTLTDILISKTMNVPQTQQDQGQKDEQQKQEPGQNGGSGSDQEQQEREGSNSQGQEEQGEEEQNGQDEEKQKEQGEEKNEQGEEKEQEQGDSKEGEKKDPQMILEDINPIISVAETDLQIINASVEVTKHIPEFMDLFKSEVPSELYKLKYFIRHLNVSAKLKNWEAVSSDVEEFEDTWNSVKSKVMETDEDMKIKLEQNFNELKDVVNSQNANLTGVKSRLTIENIESVIKNFKEKEKNKEKE